MIILMDICLINKKTSVIRSKIENVMPKAACLIRTSEDKLVQVQWLVLLFKRCCIKLLLHFWCPKFQERWQSPLLLTSLTLNERCIVLEKLNLLGIRIPLRGMLRHNPLFYANTMFLFSFFPINSSLSFLIWHSSIIILTKSLPLVNYWQKKIKNHHVFVSLCFESRWWTQIFLIEVVGCKKKKRKDMQLFVIKKGC